MLREVLCRAERGRGKGIQNLYRLLTLSAETIEKESHSSPFLWRKEKADWCERNSPKSSPASDWMWNKPAVLFRRLLCNLGI